MTEVPNETPIVEKESIKAQKLRLRINLGLAGFWISILTFVTSPILFFLDQAKDYKIEQQTFRPHLDVVKVETFIRLGLPSNTWEILLDSMRIRHPDSSIFDLNTTIDVDITFTLKNIGSVKATILYQLFRDTTSGDQVLDYFILSNNKEEKFEKLPQPYFSKKDINPGAEYVVRQSYPIHSFTDTSFSIHAMFIYDNGMNHLFNSYYIARFKLNEFIFNSDYDYKRKLPFIKYSKKDLNNVVTLLDDNCTTYSYTKKERKRVLKYLWNKGMH